MIFLLILLVLTFIAIVSNVFHKVKIDKKELVNFNCQIICKCKHKSSVAITHSPHCKWWGCNCSWVVCTGQGRWHLQQEGIFLSVLWSWTSCYRLLFVCLCRISLKACHSWMVLTSFLRSLALGLSTNSHQETISSRHQPLRSFNLLFQGNLIWSVSLYHK